MRERWPVVLQIPVSRAELEWLERAARVSGVTVEQLVHDALPLARRDPATSEDRERQMRWPGGEG
jgi:hypothetical protein